MKKVTLMIEDRDRNEFRRRLNDVLNRYNDERIVNIDTGMVHNNYDSQGRPQMYYYAIIILKGNALKYDFPEV